ncbi:MAG: ATP-binding cassette domain-containing protein [Succinivibrionaceae bacterium]|nr:ATP-binding cassette domain-containing protein [Succinivibrionaceae bacterium]
MSEQLQVFYPGTPASLAEGRCYKIVEGRICCYLAEESASGARRLSYLGTLVAGMNLAGETPATVADGIRIGILYEPEIPTVAQQTDNAASCGGSDLPKVFAGLYPGMERPGDEKLCVYFYRILEEVKRQDQLLDAFSAKLDSETSAGLIDRLATRWNFVGDDLRFRGAERSGSLAAAVDLMLACYRIDVRYDKSLLRDPDGDPEAALDRFAVSSGIRLRKVRLEDDFFRRISVTPLLGFKKKGDSYEPSIIRTGIGGCRAEDPVTGAVSEITAANRRDFLPYAFQFYAPFVPGSKSDMEALVSMLRFGFSGFWKYLPLFALMVALFSLILPLSVRYLLDYAIPQGESRIMTGFSLFLLVAAVSGVVIRLFPDFVLHLLCSAQYEDVQAALYDRILKLTLAEKEKFQSGDLVGRIMGAEQLRRSLFACFSGAVQAAVFSLGSFAVMLYLDVSMAFCGAAVSLGALGLILFAGRRHYPGLSGILDGEGALDGMLKQFFSGMDRIRCSGAEERIFRRVMQVFSGLLETDSRMRISHHLAQTARNLYAPSSVLVFCAVAGGLFGQYRIPAEFIAFAVAFWIFQDGFVSLLDSCWNLSFLRSEFARIAPVLNAESENTADSAPAGKIDGSIEFSGVSFRYGQEERLVLDDVSFSIMPGEFVAFVGTSGTGKSTLLKLMLGLVRPTGGAVYYGDADLAGLELGSLRRQLGVVMQNGRIFSGSIAENVTFCAPGYSQEDVLAALKLADLDEFVSELPMGIHTRVSSDTISGGQQQRLLIARALMRKPEILIMDEATSALDNIAQRKIQENLDALNITRVVVAHRLSTVVGADRIYVMDQGRIAQSGTYRELMAQGGIFRTMVLRQMVLERKHE